MTTPPHPSSSMAWNAWGEPGHLPALPDSVLELVHQVLGQPERTLTSVDEADVAIPPSALPASAAETLKDVVGAENVRTDAPTRLRHTGGKSLVDLLRRRDGEASQAPDAVVLPADHDEVVRVLEACTEAGVAVVPFGGGTSVVGGVEPLRGPFNAVIALDLGRLRRLVAVDAESMTATLEAGLRTPEAEELLAAHGFTLGHLPQSHEYATIGGYAATRSSGQWSAGYGRFEDMVQAMTVATPRGSLRLGRAPASAAGPDLRQLFLGSEGTLGIVTDVTCRVRPLPATTHHDAWTFPDWTTGTDALRHLVQAGVGARSMRLSDETETFVNASVGGGQAPSGCLALLDYAGTAEDVADARAATRRILMAIPGAETVASGATDDWRRSRTSGPYLRDALLPAGFLAETLETATTWSNLPRLYAAVGDSLRSALTHDGRSPVVLCHVSHVYPAGASLYFTAVTAAEADPIAQWDRAKKAASDAIAAHGGTITHHHAVGTDHVPWLTQEVGELGVEVLRAAKQVLDPAGVLNPGKLIP
ncbi:FAD-binding oxidoreductase [Streptomyces sp. NPDC002004]